MGTGKMLIVSFVLVVITTVIHSVLTKYILIYIIKHLSSQKKYWLPQSYWISIIVILLITASLIEASVWSLGYLILGSFTTFEESLYFSLVCYSTLGFGEITLNEEFRLLSGIEAANGILLFGWSTAIVVALVQRIYFKTNNEKL